jgi:hypothetical protein
LKARPAAVVLVLLLAFLFVACAGDLDDGDDGDDAMPSDDDTTPGDDDDDNDDDDDDDDDDNDNDDTAPQFVRPDWPLNACHIATTHNTFIWRGLQGVTTVVSSLGPIQVLENNQVFIELDVNEMLPDGDFLIDHSGTTGWIRLSSVLRNLRWWSDTRPGHQPLIIGFQWGVGDSPEVMADLEALIDEFLIGPSPLTATGPLYSLDDWFDERLANFPPDTADVVRALPRNELGRVIGYPTLGELTDRVMLEFTGSVFPLQRSFFELGGGGQIDNQPASQIENLDLIAGLRAERRLLRLYAQSPIGLNFDFRQAMRNGISNNALNHQWTSPITPAVYVFADENLPGFAPDGTTNTVAGVPARLGPLVAVAGSSAGTATFTLSFDGAIGIDDPPLVVYEISVEPAGAGDVTTITHDAEATVLVERVGATRFQAVALPAGVTETTVTVQLAAGGGYLVQVSGPTLAEVTADLPPGPAGKTLWTSPHFEPLGLSPTGACTALGPGPERVYGTAEANGCSAVDHRSYLIEVSF